MRFRASLSVVMIFFVVLLCGCSDYREIEQGYIVSSAAFFQDTEGVTVILEMVESFADSKTQLLTAQGNTADTAVKNLRLTLTKDLFFDHTAAIIVQSGMDSSKLQSVYNFCRDTTELNLGVYLVQCDDVQKLFEYQAVNGALGFDIMTLNTRAKEKQNIRYFNRFYEIEGQIASGKKINLPDISVSDNNILMLG